MASRVDCQQAGHVAVEQFVAGGDQLPHARPVRRLQYPAGSLTGFVDQLAQPSGRLELEWGGESGESAWEWHWPVAVEATPSGEFFAAYEQWRIERYSARGELVDTWRPDDYEEVDLSEIIGLAMGPDGLLYVLGTDTPRVLVFEPGGRLVRTWGETGTAPGLIGSTGGYSDGGFTVTPDGYVLNSDRQARTQRFAIDGTALGLWGAWAWSALEVISADGGSSYEVLALGGCLLALSPDGREIRRYNVFPEWEIRACVEGPGDVAESHAGADLRGQLAARGALRVFTRGMPSG